MLANIVNLNPTVSFLPGSGELQRLADGLAGWALVGTLIALVIGATMWALGSHSQNMHQSMTGRRAVMAAVLAAILIGAAPEIISFFFAAGKSVK